MYTDHTRDKEAANVVTSFRPVSSGTSARLSPKLAHAPPVRLSGPLPCFQASPVKFVLGPVQFIWVCSAPSRQVGIIRSHPQLIVPCPWSPISSHQHFCPAASKTNIEDKDHIHHHATRYLVRSSLALSILSGITSILTFVYLLLFFFLFFS
ncbi:hypothetical protein LY76DRAFT_81919 [Colletotrichum caudatum]|nr:hypothetical protein LY76DRAFT_81919 [Colletotrichum caudatum]